MTAKEKRYRDNHSEREREEGERGERKESQVSLDLTWYLITE